LFRLVSASETKARTCAQAITAVVRLDQIDQGRLGNSVAGCNAIIHCRDLSAHASHPAVIRCRPSGSGDTGRYSRSFGSSASVASPPCGEWKAYCVTAAIARNSNTVWSGGT